jgi:hypothetical protein
MSAPFSLESVQEISSGYSPAVVVTVSSSPAALSKQKYSEVEQLVFALFSSVVPAQVFTESSAPFYPSP